jgi:hypothetical protein
MPAKPFAFSERVQLILANIETVREIDRVTQKGGELEQQMWQFVKYLEKNLKTKVPEFRTWRSPEVNEYGVYTCPDSSWYVLSDDFVAIGVDFLKGLNPVRNGDPLVGWYAPMGWQLRDAFIAGLKAELPDDFFSDRRIEADEVGMVLATHIELASFRDQEGNRFNLVGFEEAIWHAFRKLLKQQPVIEKVFKATIGRSKKKGQRKKA